MMKLEIGSQLGNYKILSSLGVGGSAQVYLGEHIYLGRLAAIKVLHTDNDSNGAWEGFLKEARTIANLVHPHIVHILEFDVQDDLPYLIMDYAPNGSLRSRHPRGSVLPIPNVISYVQQVAEALQYAHDHRIIHCDVKPENMLIGQNGEILLSDFGIARVIHNTMQTQTVSGAVHIAGTVHYMAPEQFEGRAIAASDQYALAVVVYQWLCGRLPFEGGTMVQLYFMHSHKAPPSLQSLLPGIPSAVEEVVLKALAKDPRERFESVLAFARALEHTVNRSDLAPAHFPASSQTTFLIPSPPPYASLPPPQPALPVNASLLDESVWSAESMVEDQSAILRFPALAAFSSIVAYPDPQETIAPPSVEAEEALLPPPMKSYQSSESDMAEWTTMRVVSQSSSEMGAFPGPMVLPPQASSSVLPVMGPEETLLQPLIKSYLPPKSDVDASTTIRVSSQPAPEPPVAAEPVVILPRASATLPALEPPANQHSPQTPPEASETQPSSEPDELFHSLSFVLPVQPESRNPPEPAPQQDERPPEPSKSVPPPVSPKLEPPKPMSPQEIRVFISYSHVDRKFRVQLEQFLFNLKKPFHATSWHDGEIIPGKDFAQEIEKRLREAHIILLLVSQDFISSKYCNEREMRKAMERHEAQEARVIPVILRPADWMGDSTPFGKLQALPSNGKPITRWSNRDDAFLDVVKGIRKAIAEMVDKVRDQEG